jgi:hypothetical protein
MAEAKLCPKKQEALADSGPVRGSVSERTYSGFPIHGMGPFQKAEGR